ncbi:MAG: glycoside hydrolase family 15 protein [Clostridiales Family XIII bacterium]|jgi:hypothetical protein|nr:glycoside hydrolase family 15 protein [Clostridiales Family XIII bacterium]
MEKFGYSELEEYIAALRGGNIPVGKDMEFDPAPMEGAVASPYTVRVFSDGIAGLLRADYSEDELASIALATSKLRRIDVVRKPWGIFIGAASFDSDETAESTNYDAIWVRDSVWGYLALSADPKREDDAKSVLLTLLDYMASQADRIDRAIATPGLLDLPGLDGDMNAVHIRFDSSSPGFPDVMDGDMPQRWTHKQNDALGLVIHASLTAYAEGCVTLSDLTAEGAAGGGSRLEAIARLVAYLNAVKYHRMEDSGAWEELPRRNTSSIGIVVSALEQLEGLLEDGPGEAPIFADAFMAAAYRLGLESMVCREALAGLIADGYKTVHRQLMLGGESPDYDRYDPRRRGADAALLSLIYPACPQRLSIYQKLKILSSVGSLAGEYGIRRYERDNYQSGNFWWHGIRTDADPESHKKREASFITGTEAEWFFDSWYAKCCLIVAAEAGKGIALGEEPAASPNALRGEAVKHMNRALGQITGEGMYSADGKPAPSMALPESYNHIVAAGVPGESGGPGTSESWPAPSPIVPLNWAKASLTLMIAEFLTISNDWRVKRQNKQP